MTYYVQVCVVNEEGEQQDDALVAQFDTLTEAFSAQGNAAQAAYCAGHCTCTSGSAGCPVHDPKDSVHQSHASQPNG